MDNTIPGGMYNDEPPKSAKKGVNTAVTTRLADTKSFFVVIGEEEIEVVRKAYVNKLESDLNSANRNISVLQGKVRRLTKLMNLLSVEVHQLRRNANISDRFS